MSARAITGPEIPAIDILDEVAVSVPCASCGGHYPVTLRQVLVAQDLLHEDCPAQREAEWLTTAYAGLALLLMQLWSLILLPAVIAATHYGVVLREEAFLERRFGSAYEQYQSRVRRWL